MVILIGLSPLLVPPTCTGQETAAAALAGKPAANSVTRPITPPLGAATPAKGITQWEGVGVTPQDALPTGGARAAEGVMQANDALPAEGVALARGVVSATRAIPPEGAIPADGAIPEEDAIPAEGATKAEDAIPTNAATPQGPSTVAGGEAPSTGGCWVYTHMNKSGGTTVKRLLRPALDANGISYGLFDNPQWKKGVQFLKKDFLQRGFQLVWGGYTEGQ